MERSAKELVEEGFRRLGEGDETVVDELIAEDFVNHAAGPQGREGWRQILAVIKHDLGAQSWTQNHHFIGDGDLVAHHMTIHGVHCGSTMPLLQGIVPTGREVTWTYIHIWRAEGGQLVEHWACRDDVGLLAQVGAWPPPGT
jgi:predicted ester cyclase